MSEKKGKSPWVHFIAGGVGGTAAAMATTPLEVVKTRLQGSRHLEIAQNARFGTVIIQAFRDILKNEGITGFWRGIGPTLVGVGPSRAIHFATYNASKSFLVQTLKMEESNIVYLTSAVIAGVSVATVTAPIWLVKTRMQLQRKENGKFSETQYKNSFDCARRVYREEGIRAFYKGLIASYIGVSETAIQFVLYERFKLIVQKQKYMHDNKLSSSVNISPNSYSSISLSPFEYLATASVAKLIAAMATYPHEVVRTRVREQRAPDPVHGHKYKGFIQTLQVIAREEGVKGLYGGMGAHLLRVVPNAAIMFFTYETVLSLFK